jgi:5-(aminomethyl)-3-furanmethanol phosphate kinase
VLTVVKIGGSLARDDSLKALCTALGELSTRHSLLIVPGGGEFADTVRDADRRFGLADATAHRMAILGMEQYGLLLRDLLPEAARNAVVMPAGLALDGLPESWEVTSDSIAAWVAGRFGAGRLVLVKQIDGLFARGALVAHLTVAELAALRPEGVDPYLPVMLERARYETWVIGAERVVELFERGSALGTRIGLLPSIHG